MKIGEIQTRIRIRRVHHVLNGKKAETDKFGRDYTVYYTTREYVEDENPDLKKLKSKKA
jgi:hypothetical protein